MQNIIILDTNNDKVIVQAQEKVYMDTINNFFVDYGKEIEYKSIDYNCGTESCWLNGVAFQQYPNEICEDILKSIDELIAKKAAREYIALTFDELKAIKGDNGFLTKEYGYVYSRPYYLACVLEDFSSSITDKVIEAIVEKCPKCNEETLIREGGCARCTSCGYDKCGS